MTFLKVRLLLLFMKKNAQSDENDLPFIQEDNFSKTPTKYTSPKINKKNIKVPNTVSKPKNKVGHESNFKVFLRIRPLLPNEEHADFEVVGKEVIARPPPKAKGLGSYAERKFKFDEIFTSEASQQEIYEKVAIPLLNKCLQGKNCLLFAYGATSAGKTFTLQGDEPNPGLIPKIVITLLSSNPEGYAIGILISCVEIYNEKYIDLFGDPTKSYKSLQDLNAIENECKTIDDLKAILNSIQKARKQAGTKNNPNSSRSHCLFMVKIIKIPIIKGVRTNDITKMNQSKLYLVDLAGVEKVSTTELNSKIDGEAKNINSSMHVLGRCVKKLRELNKGKNVPIPFRESALTFLLKEFFTNSRDTAIIINISPSTKQFNETLFSLEFALDAIECNVKCKGDDKDNNDIHIVPLNFDDEEEINNGQNNNIKLNVENHLKASQEFFAKILKIQEETILQLENDKSSNVTSKLQKIDDHRKMMKAKEASIEEIKMKIESKNNEITEIKNEVDELDQQIKAKEQEINDILQLETQIKASINENCEKQEQHKQHMKNLEEEFLNEVKSFVYQINQIRSQSYE